PSSLGDDRERRGASPGRPEVSSQSFPPGRRESLITARKSLDRESGCGYPRGQQIMYIEEKPLRKVWIVVGIGACVMLGLVGLQWQRLSETRLASDFPIQGAQNGAVEMNPFLEMLKLLVA